MLPDIMRHLSLFASIDEGNAFALSTVRAERTSTSRSLRKLAGRQGWNRAAARE